MSYSFRQRLKIALREKDLAEHLKLTQEEVDFIKENLMDICPISDTVAQAFKESINSKKSLDEIIDQMSDAEFEDLCRVVFEKAKENGIWLKKKLMKKKKEREQAKQTDSDSDSDSDSDGDLDDEAEEQEAEVECEEK